MIKISIYIVIVGSLCVINLSILLIDVGILWSARSRSGQLTDHCEQLCLPCRYEDNTELCCSCRTSSLDRYLKMVFQQVIKGRKDERKDFGGKTAKLMSRRITMRTMNRPVVKLSGTKQPYHSQEGNSDPVTLKSWKIGGHCYMNNGMKFRNGRIVVPINGTYNIYSLINIMKLSNESLYTKYEIGIYKYNILTMMEEKLSDSYILKSRTKDGFYSTNMFVSLDAYLQKHDEIYVKASNTKFIRNPSLNIFGLYML